jgi:hypothetical protein
VTGCLPPREKTVDGAMQTRELFLNTVRDLANRTRNPPSEYELLGSSLLLRKLFFDGQNLVEAVNKAQRVELLFDVIEPRVTMPSCINAENHLFLAPGFDWPNLPQRTKKDRKAFFGMYAGQSRGQIFTVGEMIKYYAHVVGGVHLGKPKTLADKSLVEIEQRLSTLFDKPLTMKFLQNSGRIVCDALKPLVDRLR